MNANKINLREKGQCATPKMLSNISQGYIDTDTKQWLINNKQPHQAHVTK